MVNDQDNTIDNIMNVGNDTRVRDDEHGIEAHKKSSYNQNNTKVNYGNDDENEQTHT